MRLEHWQEVKGILYSALEIEPGQRGAYLKARCGDDLELRREIESLLAAHDNAAERFESPAVEMIAGVVSNEQSDAMVGRSIGHYDIIDKLGLGKAAVVKTMRSFHPTADGSFTRFLQGRPLFGAFRPRAERLSLYPRAPLRSPPSRRTER